MNHRELVLSARKKAKFHFLSLPEELQDELIDGLDGQTLTLEGARDFLRERGHVLSHEAIAGYYRAVRAERRIHDATQEMTRVVESFGDQPLEENVRVLTNYLIATAVQGVATGDVGFRDIDLAKVIAAIAKAGPAKSPPSPSPLPGGEGGGGRKIPDAATLKSLRDQLGL